MAENYIYNVKVYYEDTDAGGVVYYANYLKFIERARTDLIQKNHYSNLKLKNEYKLQFIVKSCNIEFNRPAKLEDNLTIKTSIEKISKIQIYLKQDIYREDENILNAKVRIAVVNINGKISRLPENLLKIFNP